MKDTLNQLRFAQPVKQFGGLVQKPWEDWVPGVLNRKQMKVLCEKDLFSLNVPFSEDFLDESSIDLHLTAEAFRMLKGSVKPSREQPYNYFLQQPDLAEACFPTPESDKIFSLTTKETYVFKLRERLKKPLADLGFHGQATAKSSVGRVDVLARLIVDGMDTYECFSPDCFNSGSGDMYLEITPITFNVLVKADTSLSQLRLFYGDPRSVEVKGEELFRAVYTQPKENEDGSLTVDITDASIGELPAAAFYAEPPREGIPPIPLWIDVGQKYGEVDPSVYWKLKRAEQTETSEHARLKIESEKFYILRSKEKICVPAGIAVYCRASDETIGEMRIHYAGFVHPLFGRRRKDGMKGTPLIFEVRGHQVNVSLADGERMANLTFYRMSEDAPSNQSQPAPYEDQQLKLSKFFRPWAEKLKFKEGTNDGTVEAG